MLASSSTDRWKETDLINSFWCHPFSLPKTSFTGRSTPCTISPTTPLPSRGPTCTLLRPRSTTPLPSSPSPLGFTLFTPWLSSSTVPWAPGWFVLHPQNTHHHHLLQGHDGFQWPGSGDYFHMLHHKHFDCNYGAMHVPLDWIFGTYAGSKEEVRRGGGSGLPGLSETPGR